MQITTSKNQRKLLKTPKKESFSLCAICRGTKFLCGKSRCPVIVRHYSRDKIKPLMNNT